MGLSGLLDHTAVIHELLSHPDIDIVAQVTVLRLRRDYIICLDKGLYT